MTEQKKKIFEGTLTSAFDHDSYVQFLRELLDNMQLVAPNKEIKPYSTFSAAIDHYRHIGNYVGTDKNKVALFSICLKNDKNLENARSMQRAFVKTLLENSDCAGALVAFYTLGDLAKWRLSLVRMDYEFSKGKLSEKLTPAKRYSYLVGDKEPCHTAQERLYPIFVADDLDPSLDELEEAFSVEAVTKDFFDQYREKYLDLKEFLDGNEEFIAEAESRGFNSEQFAKKLMGQIVFLYFIQRKGWLGVNAFPFKLTEREYKSGFYRSGKKPKELMPYVYKQMQDGFFYRDNKALLSLTPEDETLLSTLVKGDAWGDGPKDFMRQIFEGCKNAGKNFFDDYLEPLFYTGLNQNRGDNAFFPPLHRCIPFLNGGLFEEMEGYDWRNNDFRIPNELFSNADTKGRDADGILDVFDRYNFTMAEDEPMEREVAIDPEMLGKVFENLLDVTDRKSKGAFYTPREIVHYMCQETIINYLANKTGIPEEDIQKFILYGEYFRDEDTKKTLPIDNETGQLLRGDEIYYHKYHMEFDKAKDLEIPASIFCYKSNVNRLQEIDDLLANVRVVDLAVGSGAFPLGMLTEIIKARDTITTYMIIDMNGYQRLSYRSMRNSYRMKRETIKNSIFACDVEASATDITKLRLWLSLVIDNQIMDQENDEFGYTTKPRELPNLDCNIICGNSLMEQFCGIKLITKSSALNNLPQISQTNLFDETVATTINKLIELQSRLYDEKDHVEKNALKDQIQEIYDRLILEQIGNGGEVAEAYYKAIQQPSRPFVLWQMYFPRVFRDNGGFDIVIGNPPYVDSEEMTRSMPEEREIYTKSFKCAKGNWDLFVLFIEKGFNLLRKNGVISFIVPNKLVSAPYTVAIRKLMAENSVQEMRDYSDVNVFKSAAVYPVVFRVKASSPDRSVIMDVMEDMEHVANHNVIEQGKFYQDIDWDKYFHSSQIDLDIIDKMNRFPKLGDIAKVNGAATVNEAYLVKEFIFDGSDAEADVKKFINTGGIDPYKSTHGKTPIRYLKGSYEYPLVHTDDLKNMSEKRFAESNAEKIIIGGMTKILECYYDAGEYLAGKSTTLVYGCEHLKYIIAVLNSRLMTYFYQVFYNSMSLAGGFYRIGAPQVKLLPIAFPENGSKIAEIEEQVDSIQQLLAKNSYDAASEIMKAIDSTIYQIYGLSEMEIESVESGR